MLVNDENLIVRKLFWWNLLTKDKFILAVDTITISFIDIMSGVFLHAFELTWKKSVKAWLATRSIFWLLQQSEM